MLVEQFPALQVFQRVVLSAYWLCWRPLAIFITSWLHPKIQPFTYADNWSWLASEQRAHFVAFRQMQEAVSFLRLQLDSKKSWHWATTKIFRQACIDFHEQQSQFEAISVKTQTKDLGEMVHYDKSCTLGFQRKMDEAKNRMKRIEWIPASLQRKAMLIQSSCWPLALYTADTTYIWATALCCFTPRCFTCFGGLLAYFITLFGMPIALKACQRPIPPCFMHMCTHYQTLCELTQGGCVRDHTLRSGV